MASLSITNDTWDISITCSRSIDVTDTIVTSLVQAIKALDATIRIATIVVRESATPKVYNYAITSGGGRQWKQTLDFSLSTVDPLLTYDVSVGWKATENKVQRDLRDLVVKLVDEFGATKIEITRSA